MNHDSNERLVGMANQTNALVTGMQIPVDAAFLVES